MNRLMWPLRYRFLPPQPVFVVLGLLLLAACAWKGHALLTQPIFLVPHFWDTRGFQTGLVVGELFFGLWLLCGLYPRTIRLLSLTCFFAFLEVNSYLFLSGEKSCPCFGTLHVHPGQSALLDLAAFLALLLCKPFAAGAQPSARSHPGRFRAWLIAFALAGIPAVVVLGRQPDSALLLDLRQDRALAERLSFAANNPSNGELLAFLQKNTGVSMTAETDLAEQRPGFGSVEFQKVAAWLLMEQMVGQQAVHTSWVKTEQGYRFVRAPLWQGWLHWIVAAILAGLVSAALVLLHPSRGRSTPKRAAGGKVGGTATPPAPVGRRAKAREAPGPSRPSPSPP
jgi:hypothetical protein